MASTLILVASADVSADPSGVSVHLPPAIQGVRTPQWESEDLGRIDRLGLFPSIDEREERRNDGPL